jgi:hypothetical protein
MQVMGTEIRSRREAPSAAEVAAARKVEDYVYGCSREHGVVVHWADGSHTVQYCPRLDDVQAALVPFYAWYDRVRLVEAF